MAKAASRVIHFRSTALFRWLSTASATEIATGPATAVTKEGKRKKSVFYQLSSLISKDTDAANVSQTLDEWVKSSKILKKFDIISLVNHFRKSKRYHHALRLLEWMDKNLDKLTDADRARYIDLLSKINGVASAEKYFDSLEESARNEKTYGALLNCYCGEKALDKASNLFEKIKELNFASPLSYANMMTLYLSTAQPEKVPVLAKEMEAKNIAANLYTYNQLMNSYASLKDLDAVEGVLEKMKTNKVECDWFTYGNLATIYVNAGLLNKANATLEKMEKIKNLHDYDAFHTLISLYGQTSNLSGVNRVWKSLKATFPKPINLSYLIMLLSLSKFGDLDSLEKCFREWESGFSNYDVRVSNVLLESYLKRNMIKEAELLYENMVEKGGEPNLKTLDLFTNFYIKNRQVDLALKYLEMGASKAKPEKNDWFPNDETIRMFLKYFEEENDVDRAEKFCKSMKLIGRLDNSVSVYDSLRCTNNAALEK